MTVDRIMELVRTLPPRSAAKERSYYLEVIERSLVDLRDGALSAQLSEHDCVLLDCILEGFADCGETSAGNDVLLDFARRGYLECERYAPTAKAHQAIAAWRTAGGQECEVGYVLEHRFIENAGTDGAKDGKR